jgi:hypothetical protein
MGKTREGDGGSPYTKPPKPHPGPFVPAPSRLAKGKKNDIFHAKTTKPGNSVNDIS